jgi:hypothetical protein
MSEPTRWARNNEEHNSTTLTNRYVSQSMPNRSVTKLVFS